MIKRLIAYIRKRRLYAAIPELRHIYLAREEARRRHKAYKHFDETRKAVMTAALREGR